MTRFRPSVQPSSRKRSTNAAVQSLWTVGVFAPKNPTRGDCCARATHGHVAVNPAITLMISRRLIRSPRRRARAAWEELQHQARGRGQIDDQLKLARLHYRQ